MPTGLTLASPASLAAARETAALSSQRDGVPVRKAFVRHPPRSANTQLPPLARLHRAGSSVAIKLLLALIWRSSAKPYASDRPARAWATLLDLPDPEGRGARRISAALKLLEREGLIETREVPGAPRLVTLKDESGDGRRYALPSTAFTLATINRRSRAQREREIYFKVPAQLWLGGYIQALSGPGLTMLLILLAEQGGDGREIWISPPEFERRYGVSEKTRTAGTRDLRRRDLLIVRRRGIGVRPNTVASVFDVRRTRNVYTLTALAQTMPGVAEEAPVAAPEPGDTRATEVDA